MCSDLGFAAGMKKQPAETPGIGRNCEAPNDATRKARSRRPRTGTLIPEEVRQIRLHPPRVMSAAEAAAYFGLSERSFRSFARQGVFPSIKVGRRRLFRRDAIDAALVRLENSTISQSER